MNNTQRIDTPENLNELKLEFNRQSFKRELKKSVGKTCVNCGSTKGIQYHHIVPLALGGTNKTSNIVPLCGKCHQAAHGARNIREIFASENTGRPRRQLPEDYKDIMNQYLTGQIGQRECHEKLNLSKATKLTDCLQFKEYIKERNIKSYKNRIDRICAGNCTGRDYTVQYVSKIIFNDGTEEVHYVGEYDLKLHECVI